jgi:hypothetical protein
MGAFFLLRLNDHVQYLNKITATLDGRGDFRGCDHHSCKLGKWIDSAGPDEATEVGPAARAVFDSLLEPHEQFHAASGKALEMQAAGQNGEATRAITDMHRLSSLLVTRLLELDKMASTKK